MIYDNQVFLIILFISLIGQGTTLCTGQTSKKFNIISSNKEKKKLKTRDRMLLSNLAKLSLPCCSSSSSIGKSKVKIVQLHG